MLGIVGQRTLLEDVPGLCEQLLHVEEEIVELSAGPGHEVAETGDGAELASSFLNLINIIVS